MKTLQQSDREAAALAFIRRYHSQNGMSPSMREVGNAIGVKSMSLVRFYLDGLEKDGKIRRVKFLARGIVLL